MATVNLTKKVVTEAGKRFCPVVVSDNGRIKPDWVMVNGQPERHPEGTYYIDWNFKGKRNRQAVGKNAQIGAVKQTRKEAELKAIAQGITVVSEDTGQPRRRIDVAISEYLDEIRLTKKKKTDNAYTRSLKYFVESCTKTFLDEIERIDMLKFGAYLRDQAELAPRTCYNKFENVMSFFKWAGLSGVAKKGDWPDYVEEEPEVYDKEDLDTFFGACDSKELLIFKFFRLTGFREQEVMYAAWKDINFRQRTVSMRWKPQLAWTPKAYKERTVPLPDELHSLLLAEKPSRHHPDDLLFPNTEGRPNGHLLRYCVAIAKRAGLRQEDWWLHKFRATYATTLLRHGTDLKTVQKFLGHTDLQSTMRYLSAATAADVQNQVNAAFK